MRPLTPEQRQLAEENHSLVYAFLKENGLSEELFYDVVVFGYLCAIQDHCEKRSLKHYRLSTVAWRRMRRELYSHYRYLETQKAQEEAVSLSEPISPDAARCWEDILPDPCDALCLLHTELTLHGLALADQERRLLRMKRSGARMHDIAKAERLTFKQINLLLDKLYRSVRAALYES